MLPSREGASNSPAISIGAGGAQLADFKIDESRSPYHIFRVTIDRIDQGRVGVITNLVKEFQNGHLRIALNSTALGPGNYQLTIEGLNWRAIRNRIPGSRSTDPALGGKLRGPCRRVSPQGL